METTLTNPIRRSHRAAACILTLALLATPALALNTAGLLRDMPTQKFNAEDMRLFTEAAKKALDEASLGQAVKWENPATRSQGQVKVLREFTWKDQPCRRLDIGNQANGRKESYAVNLCRVAGQWRLVSPSELSER